MMAFLAGTIMAVAMSKGPVDAVSAQYAGSQPNQPPFVTRFFDVTLKNEAKEPRWFIFPRSLTQPRTETGGVDSVEVFKFGGTGTVLLGDFLGNGGFKAVLLPAHAEVTLKKLPIKSFEEKRLSGKTELPVVIASSITVGGKPAESWMGGAAASDAKASVVAEQGGGPVRSTQAPEMKEQPVQITETGRAAPVVDITP